MDLAGLGAMGPTTGRSRWPALKTSRKGRVMMWGLSLVPITASSASLPSACPTRPPESRRHLPG